MGVPYVFGLYCIFFKHADCNESPVMRAINILKMLNKRRTLSLT